MNNKFEIFSKLEQAQAYATEHDQYVVKHTITLPSYNFTNFYVCGLFYFTTVLNLKNSENEQFEILK